MVFKKSHWFWNFLLVVTMLFCIVLLVLHYKNWIRDDAQKLDLRSGIYNVAIPYSDMNSVDFVERIPQMERLNGFSALAKETGVFREFQDSLTDKKVYVFVDNIHQPKIKLVYQDSVQLYLNLNDSLASIALIEDLKVKIKAAKASN